MLTGQRGLAIDITQAEGRRGEDGTSTLAISRLAMANGSHPTL